MKILSVVGNRPQFIKSAPVSVALRDYGIAEISLHTGQHYDRELSEIFFDELGLTAPLYRLEAGSLPREAMLQHMRPGLLAALAEERPDYVLVHGDTNSTLAGARAAAEAGIPLAHVEAGLRSGDWSMPEEHNRVETDRIASLLFCPDERSRETLQTEGVEGRALVVGDVMMDASLRFAPIARERSEILARLGLSPRQFAVATVHREANVQPERLRRILAGLCTTGETVVLPAHPRTAATIRDVGIPVPPGVRLIPPLGYLDLAALASQARVIVTDSGGLQKEAYWYRVPCVTLRAVTEWPDTVNAGANVLVDDEPERIAHAIATAAMPDSVPRLYGDGRASDRIAAALASLRRNGH